MYEDDWRPIGRARRKVKTRMAGTLGRFFRNRRRALSRRHCRCCLPKSRRRRNHRGRRQCSIQKDVPPSDRHHCPHFRNEWQASIDAKRYAKVDVSRTSGSISPGGDVCVASAHRPRATVPDHMAQFASSPTAAITYQADAMRSSLNRKRNRRRWLDGTDRASLWRASNRRGPPCARTP